MITPAGYGMMQGTPQFVQPGMQQYPTMQQQRMMSQGQHMMSQGQPMMAPGQRMMAPGMYSMMGMRMGPPGAPPAYSRQMQDNYNSRKKEVTTGGRPSGKSEEQIRKERQFQQQRDKLKQFGKASSSGLDPNKLVDSIFGTSDKPKSKPKNITIPSETDIDSSFGDFLSSPPASQTERSANQIPGFGVTANQSSSNPVTVATVNTHNSSLQQTQVSPPKQDKKDLEKMMFECSDLKAPQKAKLFHKPALKELQPAGSKSQVPVHHDSQNARKWNQSWNQSEELSDLFIQEAVKDIQTMPKKPVPKHTSPTSKVAKHTSPTTKHPPKPPPWLAEENLLPEIYKHVLEASLVDGVISTDRLYPILMLSGLPKEFMGHIWSLCNKVTPGQLVKPELYQMLALIGLAQNNYQITSTDILNRCPHPPVPRFQQQGPPQKVPQGPHPGPQGAPQVFQMAEQPGQGPSAAPQMMPGTVPGVAQNPQQMAANGPHAVQHSVPVQGLHIPQQGPVSGSPGVQVSQSVQAPSSTSLASVSTPATLTVTQLPSAGAPQGMLGLTAMTTEEDDFADFQAAPPVAPPPAPPTVQPAVPPTLLAAPPAAPKPAALQGSFGDLMTDVKNEKRSSLKDQAKYLYSVPTPDDAAVAATLSPHDLQQSNVENFFGSDDSSEVTYNSHTKGVGSHNSLDDEYFDGYKSADSKRSDSTSQFSTDQSENEDFKNFENYLDEFQKKKEQKEKDSPFHRVMSSSSPKKEIGSPSKVFPKVFPQKLPEPGKQGQKTSQIQASTDDFADFADFQSAPLNESKQTLGSTVITSVSLPNLKTTDTKTELIGDEDKYAALRVLEFSSPSNSDTTDLMGEPSVFSGTDDNWADFQNVPTDADQSSTSNSTQHLSQLKPDANSKTEEADSDWADFATATPNNEDMMGLQSNDLSMPSSIPVAPDTLQTGLSNNSAQVSESNTGNNVEPAGDDWADFQQGDNGEFTDFQSPSGDLKTVEEEKPSGLVSIKKGGLGKDDILGLFKVRESPVTVVNSRDDDLNMYGPLDKDIKEPVVKKDKQQINSPLSPKRKAFSAPRLSSDGDDFMGPPPTDHFHDEDPDEGHFGTYSRGYDLDDMMMPPKKDEKEQKHMYGMYGLNTKFVLSGHKKEGKDIHKEKSINEDDDNDSISSKDNDFKPKFSLGKDIAEDSQSIASLDFVVSKRVQNIKESDADSGDAQSVSSNEFVNFENTVNKDILPESKSLDSLDLRRDVNDDGSQGSSDKEKDSLDKEPDEDGVLADLERIPAPESGLPVIGDRYSNILHDIPGSDKHAYEWQRCLDNCCGMIKDANNIFNSVSSSAVCNEIIRSSQGSEYIQGIIEIYRVVCKIAVSIKTAAIHTDKLKQLLKDIDLAWNNLTAFLVGGSVMPDSKSLGFSHGVLMSDDTTAQYLACGVCLLSVDMKLKGGGQENGNSIAKLTYSGRQYHTACANLWINCVDSTLPALKLPELL